MTRLYILNTYGEYGPEEIRATTNPETMGRILHDCCAANIKTMQEAKWLPRYIDDTTMALNRAQEKLKALIAKDEPGSNDLTPGWGGYQLHIVELEQ